MHISAHLHRKILIPSWLGSAASAGLCTCPVSVTHDTNAMFCEAWCHVCSAVVAQLPGMQNLMKGRPGLVQQLMIAMTAPASKKRKTGDS